MIQKHPLRNAAFCGLLLAAIAVPVHAFADSPLGSLYNTETSQPRQSDRFPRARYQDASKANKYVWGDMQLDVFPGETIQCGFDVQGVKGTDKECFYTPSSSTFTTFTSATTTIPSAIKYAGAPDAVKVGFRINSTKELNEAFAQLDPSKTNISVKNAKGRLWAYVWDFNTSWKEYSWDSTHKTAVAEHDGKVGEVKEVNYLNTSFFARLPNGHPVEIKLDKVSGDAFSLAAFQTRGEKELEQSLPWNYSEWNSLNSSNKNEHLYNQDDANKFAGYSKSDVSPPTAIHSTPYDRNTWLNNYAQQGGCDGDNWGEYNVTEYNQYVLPSDSNVHYQYFYSGEIKPIISSLYPALAGAYDNYARQCLEQFKDKAAGLDLAKVPLYLEKPAFSSAPKIHLGNVTVIPDGTSDACVFPVIKNSTTKLTINGLGTGAGKGQLVCVDNTNPTNKHVVVFDIKPGGTATPSISLPSGKYNCYVERVEQLSVDFADAEQVGAMRMYEVLPDGGRVPLQLNWDDNSLSKTSIHPDYPSNGSTSSLKESDIFRLPGKDKPSPIKDAVISSNYNAGDSDIKCAEGENVNARCWGEYKQSSTSKIDNKKFGIGNGDIVNTWTYYPVSDRFFFTLTAVKASLYPIDAKYLTNGCTDGSIDPTKGKPDPKLKPADSDTEGGKNAPDGIPDIVEGHSGIKVFNPDTKKETEIPAPNTDGDKKKDGSDNPDYKDTDSDGDGIPDKVECHFDPSHTGYGYVNGCEDTDHDGIPDYKDTDSDNDGVPDRVECFGGEVGSIYIDGCVVSDPGTKYVPDYKNPDVKGGGKPGTGTGDADGDGIPDNVENKGADPTQAGKKGADGITRDKDGNVDTDGDGIPDYKDPDSDNDGIPDKVEAGPNPANPRKTSKDSTAKPDYQNPDSDGDGIPDKIECIYDASNNGLNFVEGCIVTNGNGIPDYRNPNKAKDPNDTDGDGIPDSVENQGKDPSKAASNHSGHVQPGYDKDGNVDTDGDGIPDYKDTDSDNDGVPDKVEAGPDPTQPVKTSSKPGAKPDYQNPDSDDDGIPDGIECPGYKDEKASHLGPQVKGCPDTDGDGVPDYQDKDSDGDGTPDDVENKDDKVHRKNLDVDGDGKPDVVDSDNDGTPDYKDKDSDNDGIPDKVENKDADTTKAGKKGSDGITRDKDGNVDTDGDGKPDYRDTDSDGDKVDDKDECHYGSPKSSDKNVKYANGCISTKAPDDVPDYRDKNAKGDDTDHDGIPDVVECPDKSACPNSNAPGTKDSKITNNDPDYNDPDSDGDGIPDKVECHYDPSHTGPGYVNGCEDTDGDGTPDYKDTDSNNDGTPDKDQCQYDSTAGKCKVGPADPFAPGGYRHPKTDSSNNKPLTPTPGSGGVNPGTNPGGSNNGATIGDGLVAGGCGCASTPDDSLPGELLIVGLVGAVAIASRRRKK